MAQPTEIEVMNCKECGHYFTRDAGTTMEHCNTCSDPYYLEEHHGG